MKVEEIKDYAYPCMMAEKKLKLVYEFMLQNKHEGALSEATLAITYIAEMMEAIKGMKNK